MENKAQKLLESLTPGGSEFVDDPEYCVKYVKEFEEDLFKSIKNLVIQKNKLIKENLELLEAGRLMIERFEGLVGLGEIKDKMMQC